MKNKYIRNLIIKKKALSALNAIPSRKIGSKECRFREDGDCSKCSYGLKDSKKNELVGVCIRYIGEEDCTAQ